MGETVLLDHTGKPLQRTRGRAKELAEFLAKRMVRGSYDAARDEDGLKNYWVHADALDADSANSRDVRHKLIRRSRYEVANNGYADGIAQTYSTDLIGIGPSLRMQTGSLKFNQMVEREFYFWWKVANFRQKLWCMAHAKHMDGEAIGVARINPRLRHRVKLDVTLYEAEQCQTPMPPINDLNYIDGRKFDEFGNSLWYDFLGQHPGSANGARFDSRAVRVEADRVLHWYKLRRPGQHRGVPECASTLNLGAAARRFREANLSTAEKVAAWTLLLETQFTPDELEAVDPMSMLEIAHGMMTALPNSVKTKQLTAEHPAPAYFDFVKQLINEYARAKNMPLNKAMCNSSDYNYASGRLDHQTYYGSLDVDRADCDEQVLDPLFRLWFDLAVREFGWLGGDAAAISEAARSHVWDWPKHRVADVEAEANATRTRLESCQTFPHLVFTDSGLDFEDEIAKAATTFGVSVDDMRRRMLDVILPPPKSEAKPSQPAVNGHMNGHRLPALLNGNGAHHG